VETRQEWTGFPSFKDAKKAFERRYAADCLAHAQGNVSEAARISGKDRRDFYDLLRRSGLEPEDFRT
jgi:two-component system response regulator GlrR